MKSNKNEELKSRRDFFKKAAKSALPILGAVVLSTTPIISKASETATGCKGDCISLCAVGCNGSCKGSCEQSCSGNCYNTCHGSCSGGCARQAYA